MDRPLLLPGSRELASAPDALAFRAARERLDLDVAAGVRFAKNDPNVVAFRQLLLHKVVQVLR